MGLDDAPPCECKCSASLHQKLWLDVDEFKLGRCLSGACRCSNYRPTNLT